MKRLHRISPEFKVLQPQWVAEEIRQLLLKPVGLYVDGDIVMYLAKNVIFDDNDIDLQNEIQYRNEP